MQVWRTRLWAAVLVVAVLAAGGCRREADEGTVLHLYAPCGMEMPFMDLEALFERAHPGVDVQLLLDNAHILAERVLEGGERPDLVVSPGGHEFHRLTEAGFLTAADTRPFSRMDLCLFVPRANQAGVKAMADLTRAEVKVVAMADPDKTSIGHHTLQALQRAGLWEAIKDKVVTTGDASQTYKHVASEKADASFAYRSCPLKTAPDKLEYSKVRIVESVPADLYGPAYATIAVVADTPRRALAEAFIELVLSPVGRETMAAYDLPSLEGEAMAR